MKVKSSGEFELAPAGSHLARCYGLIDLGTQPHAFQGDQWTPAEALIATIETRHADGERMSRATRP